MICEQMAHIGHSETSVYSKLKRKRREGKGFNSKGAESLSMGPAWAMFAGMATVMPTTFGLQPVIPKRLRDNRSSNSYNLNIKPL